MNANEECEAYRLTLRIEYDRLIQWGETSGLLDEVEGGPASYEQRMRRNGPLVVAILSRLDRELKTLRQDELKWKYLAPGDPGQAESGDKLAGGCVPAAALAKTGDIAELQQQEPLKVASGEGKGIMEPLKQSTKLKEAIANMDAAVQRKKYPRGLNRLKRLADGTVTVTKQPKRFEWAIRSGNEFKKKLDKVQLLVRSLEEMLGHDQMALLVKRANEFKLEMLQLTTDVAELKVLLKSQHDHVTSIRGTTLVEASQGEGAPVGSVDEAENRFTAFLNAAIQFSIDMYELKPELATDLQAYDLKSELSVVSKAPANESRTITDDRNQYRWVEWKRYSTSDPLERTPSKADKLRVRKLVALLRAKRKPIEFGVPPCLGYFQDLPGRRFGIVFEPPQGVSSQPTSLLDRLGTSGVLLSTRVTMAQHLSQWLLYLHAVNWLHKGLRSANVLFFSDDGSREFGQAYVTGFDYSRMSKGDHTTQGPSSTDDSWRWYIHPDYLGSKRNLGYRKTYDIFSLGIILIELAYWKPIKVIHREWFIERMASVVDARETVHGRYKPADAVSCRC